MRIPFPPYKLWDSTPAAETPENATNQNPDDTDQRTDGSGQGITATAYAMELTDDAAQVAASIRRRSSPETVVGDEGTVILTPASSTRSVTPVMEAARSGSNGKARDEAVDAVGFTELEGSRPAAASSNAETRMETSDRQGFFEGGNGGTSEDVPLDSSVHDSEATRSFGDAETLNGSVHGSEATPSLEDESNHTQSHGNDSTVAQTIQIPSGTYANVQLHNGGGGITITHNNGTSSIRMGSAAARSNNNAFPTSNSFSFANSFTSRFSNPATPSTSFRSGNIFSSNSTSSYTSSSSRDTFTNQTLSARYFTSGTTVTNCRLTACTGRNLEITNCRFTSCNFSNSEITNCQISSCNLTNDELTNCSLSDSNVVGGTRTNCSYRNSNLN